MNPISSHHGPERRKSERNRLITFWAVVAINVIVSTGALIVASNSGDVGKKAEKAHCVLVAFLVGSNLRNQASIDEHPPGSTQQRAAVAQTGKLIDELRETGIHCIPIPAEILKNSTQKKKGQK